MTNSCKKFFSVALLFTLILGCTIFSTPYSYADDSIPDLDYNEYDVKDIGNVTPFNITRDDAEKLASDIKAATMDTLTALDWIYFGITGSSLSSPNSTASNNLLSYLKNIYGTNSSNGVRGILNKISSIDSDTDSLLTSFNSFYDYFVQWQALNQQQTIAISTKVNSFAAQNHLDLIDIDSDLNDFSNRNHNDINNFSDRNHNDVTNFQIDFDDRYSYLYTNIGSFLGAKNNLSDSSYLSVNSSISDHDIYFFYHIDTSSSLLNVISVNLPIRTQQYSDNFYISLLDSTSNYNDIPIQYIYSPFTSSIRVFIFDYNLRNRNADIVFKVVNKSNGNLIYTSASSSLIYFNNEFSWILKNTLANTKSNQYLSDLKFVLADDATIEAKKDSTAQEQEFLDNFTGDGSASAKVRDIRSASDISGTVSSGVDAGGSVSDALTVFNPASALFGWFSQDCANYFIPYQPSRKSAEDWSDVVWTDDVPDLLTDMNTEVQNQIGDDK